MARDVEALVLQMSADLRRFEKSMAGMRATADKRLAEVERRAIAADKNLARIMGRAGNNMTAAFRDGLKGLAPTIAAAFSTQQIIKYADSYTALQNRLKAAGLEGERLKSVENSLYEISNRNNVAVAASAELYQRATMARENLGASDADLMRIVSGTAAALKLQGTSAGEASGALLQLGQLLGGNMVQAQEYNSLIDGLPTVLEAVAKGSDRWGGSVNKLTTDVKAGKVSAQEFSRAMLKGFGDIEKRAGNATLGVGPALESLNNQLGRYVGQTDKSLGATERMAEAIKLLADNLEVVAESGMLVVTMLGSALAGRAVGKAVTSIVLLRTTIASTYGPMATSTLQSNLMAASMGRMSAGAILASGSMKTLNASMAFFGGPVGLAVTAFAAALVYVGVEAGKASARQRDLNDALKDYRAKADIAQKAGKAFVNDTEIPDHVLKATAALTGEVKLLADEYGRAAVAAKALRLEQLRDAATKATKNRELAQNRFNAASQQEANRGVAIMPGGAPQTRTLSAAAKARLKERSETQDLLDARAIEEGKIAAWAKAEKESALSFAPKPSGSGSAPDKVDKAALAAAKRKAEAEEMFQLERKLLLAREAGDEKRIRAAEDEIRLIQLRRQYESDGMADWETRASETLAIEQRIRDATEAREKAQKRISDLIDKAQENTERYARAQQRLADIERDRLNHNLDLARLRGDEKAIRAAERELRVRERIDELTRHGDADPVGNANREANERDLATRQGQYRDMFSNAFSEGIRAAASGDLESFISNMVGSATERAMKNLGGKIFDATGLGGVVDSILGPKAADPIETGIISGGTIAATEIASAMTAAGASVAAMIASASTANAVSNTSAQIAGFLDGARASGGPVKPGGAYLVGEKGPEILRMGSQGGNIIPNNLVGNIPNGSALSRKQPLSVTVRNTYQIEGAIGREEIARSIERAQVQTANRVTQTVKRSLSGWNNNLNTLGNV